MSDEQLAEIPAKRGVVLLEHQDATPIVMITAASMRSRTKTRLAEPHEEQPENKTTKRKTPDLREITHAIRYKRCGSVFEADRAFLNLAHQIWPTRYEKLVSWKSPWFVHINISDAYPHFARTRSEFCGGDGDYVGPFISARDAEKFIGAIQDSFDLCRSIGCLRNAPNGQKCAYAEMGRCVSPSDGTISMDAYRKILAKALAFAAGSRDELQQSLREQMKTAADAQEFERAGAIKHRIERLEFFNGPQFRYVAPVEDFRFILVQKGLTTRECKVFFAGGGAINEVGTLVYPTDIKQVRGVLVKIEKLAAGESAAGGAIENLQMGLVARLLFNETAHRGLVIRWNPDITPQQLAEQIEEATDDLALRAPAVRKPKDKSVSGKAETPSQSE